MQKMESTMKYFMSAIILLMSGATSLSLAAQPMANMEASKKTTQTSHQGAGKVMSVDRDKLRIKLEHKPIKSLGWPGMTMGFNVEKESLLDGLKSGDAVQFELRQANSKEWVITKMERM